MCFDHDEYPEMANSQIVKCRKPHKCEECRETILAGDLAECHTGKYESEFYAYYLCGACEATRQRIADQEIADGCRGSEIWCPLGHLMEYCRETKLEISNHTDGQAYLAKLREPAKA